MDQAFYQKVTADFSTTEGYMGLGALATWDTLLGFQSTSNIAGNLFEIGSFKGKSATILANHVADDEKVILVDSEYEQNAMAETKTRVDAIRPGTLTHICMSDELPQHMDIGASARTCRWIHIDGGHSMAAVINDLEISETLLSTDGIICMDDFFAPHWPQVAAAVFRFLYTSSVDLHLILVGYNKGYLCRTAGLKRYLGFISENLLDALTERNAPSTIAKTDYNPSINCFGISERHPEMESLGDMNNF